MPPVVPWAAPENRSLSNIESAFKTKGYAMKQLYIGIDAHKDSNVIGLAFQGEEKPVLYGKVSSDLN